MAKRIIACDEPEPPPMPSSVEVDFERRPVLFLPDGRALVRKIGFRPEG